MQDNEHIHIWQLTIIEMSEGVWLEGTAIKGDSKLFRSHSTWMGHLMETLGLYFKKPASHISLEINTGNEECQIETTNKGHFSALLKPFQIENFEMHYKDQKLDYDKEYPHYFKDTASYIEIISDLDDTVLYSHTASVLKRMYNILFILPNKRKPVVFTYELLDWFKHKSTRVIYLSKSESNLFKLISTFMKVQDLPKGPLLLSPYLRYFQLPKPHKGKNYKYNHLKTILSQQPNKQFILMGDDTQRDMEIYTQIVKDFPDRILKVFIRQTRFNRSDAQESLWQNLVASKVEAMYFNDSDSAKKEIDQLINALNLS